MSRSLTLSYFLRRSGDVLGTVATEDVVLRRRDGDDLVLTTAQRTQILRDGLRLLAEIVGGLLDADGTESMAHALASVVPWTKALSSDERARLAREVAEAAATAADIGAPEPLGRALERWRRAARLRAAAPPVSAHQTRPVAIPDDVDDPSIEKASGVVELPLHVRWSYPRRTYDLDEPRQLRRVYEQVLREGNDDDVRRFIDVDTLVANWDQLVLPPRVRRAWADWLARRRGLDLAC